jgi:diguanylate cyclase (GGDEF)-like protein
MAPHRIIPRSKPGRIVRLLAGALALLVVTASPAEAARRHERGFPAIEVFEQRTHHGGPQTFDLVQDKRGILYFANLAGVVTYDGAWWRLIRLPNEASSDAMAVDAAGTVVTGSVNEMGYIGSDASGSAVYHSLTRLIPEEAREFGHMRSITSTPAGFVLSTDRFLFLWSEGAPQIVLHYGDDLPAPREVRHVAGTTWMIWQSGLGQVDLRSGTVTRLQAFEGQRARIVLPGGEGTEVLVASVEQGLMRFDGEKASRWRVPASDWLVDRWLTGGVVLRDGRLAITTREDGVLIVEPDGEIEQVIDLAAGLPEAILAEPLVDREGALWLAFFGPIARIDLTSPVTLLDRRRGLRGSISSVARFDERLYVSTSHGLHVLDGESGARRIESIPPITSTLLALADELLVGTAGGIHLLDRKGATRMIEGTEELEIYSFSRSLRDPARLWLGTGRGVASIRREESGWRYEGTIEGSPPATSSVIESGDTLWCGTVYDGAVRIDSPLGPSPVVTTLHHGEEISAFAIGGKVRFVRTDNVIHHVDGGGTLSPDPAFGMLDSSQTMFFLAEDRDGNVWMNTIPPRIVRRNAGGTFGPGTEPLAQVTANDIQFMSIGPEGVVWFGGDNGLYRYEPAAAPRVMRQPPPLVRRVVAGSGNLLYGGVGRLQAEIPRLPFDFRRLRVEVAPATYQRGVMYQYRLEPLDAMWGEWTEEPFVDFTNLSEGSYTLRIRSRGAGNASAESIWLFEVAPPWFRTRWAFALWFVLAAAILLLTIRLRTAALHRDAEQLRARVAERTEELRKTVEQLRAAQGELVRKNAQLEQMTLVDDLTGIANRRAFQRQLAIEWNRAQRQGEPVALILIDLDRFKDLNDRHGHQAGDTCLRSIGTFLASSVRRAGDLVARYGGEEFAILLPRTTSEDAFRLANSLRIGIEQLSRIPSKDGTLTVTASCGVAAQVPISGFSPDSLVERADRALYAAKDRGRNRVCAADEEFATY